MQNVSSCERCDCKLQSHTQLYCKSCYFNFVKFNMHNFYCGARKIEYCKLNPNPNEKWTFTPLPNKLLIGLKKCTSCKSQFPVIEIYYKDVLDINKNICITFCDKCTFKRFEFLLKPAKIDYIPEEIISVITNYMS